MTELPLLKSRNCTLNRIMEDDIPIMRQIINDKLTKKFLSELWPLVKTDEGIKQILSAFNSFMEHDEGMIWGIRLNGNLIAFVAFMDLPYNPTILYAMHPSYRSKGYMKESVELSVQYLFDYGYCSHVQTEVHNDNATSINLLQSIGFEVVKKNKQKTYLRKQIATKNG